MPKIEITADQSEIIYLALQNAQSRLTDTATDEEYEEYENLMNIVIDF